MIYLIVEVVCLYNKIAGIIKSIIYVILAITILMTYFYVLNPLDGNNGLKILIAFIIFFLLFIKVIQKSEKPISKEQGKLLRKFNKIFIVIPLLLSFIIIIYLAYKITYEELLNYLLLFIIITMLSLFNMTIITIVVAAFVYYYKYGRIDYVYIENIVNEELEKSNISKYSNLILKDKLIKKERFSIIYSVLLFIYIFLTFILHLDFIIHIFIVPIFIFFHIYYFVDSDMTRDIAMRSKNLSYVNKEPFFEIIDEHDLAKQFYVVSPKQAEKAVDRALVQQNISNLVEDNSIIKFSVMILISILLPCLIFLKPKIYYQRYNEGYMVSYYIDGLIDNSEIVIPNTYKGLNVLKINDNAFKNLYFLKDVKLPDRLLEIGVSSFGGCRLLNKVVIPNSVTKIDDDAFWCDAALKSVVISADSNLEYIGEEAFFGCHSLDTITISYNTRINKNTFETSTFVHYFPNYS